MKSCKIIQTVIRVHARRKDVHKWAIFTFDASFFLSAILSHTESFGVVQLIIRGQAARFNEIYCARAFVNLRQAVVSLFSGCTILPFSVSFLVSEISSPLSFFLFFFFLSSEVANRLRFQFLTPNCEMSAKLLFRRLGE